MDRTLASFHRFAGPLDRLVVVDILAAEGSTPRDAAAFMLVSADGAFGTVGGGRLELEAIDHARRSLAGAAPTRLVLSLGPAIGQCCGGRVTLGFETVDAPDFDRIEARLAAEAARDPEVWLFGGGHVGRALANAFGLLPVRTHVVESRANELALTPETATRHLSALPESMVATMLEGSAAVVLTHDHGLDFLIASAALARDDLAYVGMIGSQTKRATFSSQYRREGGDPERLARLICPIGTKLADKRPEVIAAMAAAEVCAGLDTWRSRR